MVGIHGKKSPCNECNVEVHGAGIKTFVLHRFLSFGCALKYMVIKSFLYYSGIACIR